MQFLHLFLEFLYIFLLFSKVTSKIVENLLIKLALSLPVSLMRHHVLIFLKQNSYLLLQLDYLFTVLLSSGLFTLILLWLYDERFILQFLEFFLYFWFLLMPVIETIDSFFHNFLIPKVLFNTLYQLIFSFFL